MRVLLVNPPCDPWETTFPLGLAYVAAALKAAGHEVAGLDVQIDRPFRWPDVTTSHDIVGFTALSSTWPVVRDLLRRMPPSSARLTIVGGPHATLFPREVLDVPNVDVLVRGEGETSAVALVRAWESRAPAAIPGVMWSERWTSRGFADGGAPERLLLDRGRPCDRDVFKMDAYRGMATRRKRYTQIIATRGCRRSCAHCPASRVLGGGRVARPVEAVATEMRRLHDTYGIDEFHFEDDSLFEDAPYVVALCRAIRRLAPGIAWQCPNGSHPSDLHPWLVPELVEAGCYRVYLGLHTISPAGMRTLKRPWNPQGLGDLTAEARKYGLALGGYFTLGLPDTSDREMREDVDFAVASDLDWAQFTRFSPVPGSELHGAGTALLDRLPPRDVTMEIITKAYRRFYLSRGRWRSVVSQLNARNAGMMMGRAITKFTRHED